MSWTLELDRRARRDMEKLDRTLKERIFRFLYERWAKLDDPRTLGAALQGSELGDFWKDRVGDSRIIASIEDEKVQILERFRF